MKYRLEVRSGCTICASWETGDAEACLNAAADFSRDSQYVPDENATLFIQSTDDDGNIVETRTDVLTYVRKKSAEALAYMVSLRSSEGEKSGREAR